MSPAPFEKVARRNGALTNPPPRVANPTTLALRQVNRRKDETFDSLTGGDPFHDFWQISHGDVPVKKVIGLDQDANAAGTLVQATRGAGPGAKLGQPARGQLFLQGEPNFFRAFLGTRPLFVFRTPPVGADKEVALPLRHGRRLTAEVPAVNGGPAAQPGERMKDACIRT